MSIPRKPEGYSTVSPYLIVVGAQRVIDFLKKALDATELRRHGLPDGSVMHAEVRIGDTVVIDVEGDYALQMENPAGLAQALSSLAAQAVKD